MAPRKPAPIKANMITASTKGAAMPPADAVQRSGEDDDQLGPFHTKMRKSFIDEWEDFAHARGRLKRPLLLHMALRILQRMPIDEFNSLKAEVSTSLANRRQPRRDDR